MYRTLKRAMELLENIGTFAASGFLVVMTFLICLDALGRYLLNRPIGFTYELTELFLMVGIVYLGTSYTFREGGHVKVEFLEKRLSPVPRLLVKILIHFLAAWFIGLLAYLTWKGMMHSYRLKHVSPGMLEFPLWYSYLVMFAGVGLLCVRLALEGIDACVELIRKRVSAVRKTLP